MRVILAPMQGVLDHLMREVLTSVNDYDLCVSEFIRVVDQLLPAKVFYRIAPELKQGEVARLYFGAVDGNAEVYLNGRKVYEHKLGENYEGWDRAFTFYVHPYLKAGENILAVKVTSKNNTTASGIYKSVALIVGTQ